MAKLGKWVTAAGGVLVVVFSLIGWICVAAEKSVDSRDAELAAGMGLAAFSSGAKVNGIFQGLLLMVLGAAVAVGAVLMYDRYCKALCWLSAGIILLAGGFGMSSQLAVGGMNFYILLGALVSVVGANWCSCCQAEAGEQQAPPAM